MKEKGSLNFTIHQPHSSHSQAKAITSETLVDENSSSPNSNTNDLIAESTIPPTGDDISHFISTTTEDTEENINSSSTTTQGKRTKRTPKYLQDYD